MNKVDVLESVILSYKPQVVVITETWLHNDISDSEIVPPGYAILRNDRSSRGGGVAILYQDTLHINRLSPIAGVECVIAKICLNECSLVVGGFYRPPNDNSTFFEKLNQFLCDNVVHINNFLIAGDFNLPSIDWSNEIPEPLSTVAEQLTDLVFFHNLSQLVKEPTRISNSANSILDLFLVSRNLLSKEPVVAVLDEISDHKLITLTLNLGHVPKKKNEVRVVPVFARANDVGILDAMDESFSNFLSFYQSSDCSIDELWLFFKNLVLKCIKDFVPMKSKSIKKFSKPWLTKEVVRLERKAKRIRKTCRQRPSPANVSKLCAIRLALRDSIAEAKNYYFNVTLKNFLYTAPAKFWRHFSSKQKSQLNLTVNGGNVSDKLQLASTFNRFFCSVFVQDDASDPSFIPVKDAPSISDIFVSEEGVLSLLLKLDTKKTPGIDGIPNTFLVRYAEWCSKYLCLIFKKSLSEAQLPTEWKYSKIIPIPKGGDSRQVTCYRPISLLCSCSKMLEHIIFAHISSFLEKNNLIDNRQHGFRKGKSTVTALLETVHDFAAAIDAQSQIDVIFLDFQKAFDCVSHSKLIIKVRAILKNTALVSWIEAYLRHRQQCVSIDNVCSTPAAVGSGVPQGSVLGPLFFLIFINDIVDQVPVKIKLFADDCVIYHRIDNLHDHVQLKEALQHVEKWCETWQMKINPQKTVLMRITRKNSPLQLSYSLNGSVLSKVKSFKYLGVILTSDLRWNEHISYIKKKAVTKLGYLRRTLRQAPQDMKLLAYKTFIRPIIEYASIVWDPHTKRNIVHLESVQRKSVRFIFNMYSWRTSASTLVERAELEPLELRRHTERLGYLYKIYHNKIGIERDHFIQPVSKRITRSHHSKKLRDYNCRTDVFHNTFFPRTVREWNELPADVVERMTTADFISTLQAHLTTV